MTRFDRNDTLDELVDGLRMSEGWRRPDELKRYAIVEGDQGEHHWIVFHDDPKAVLADHAISEWEPILLVDLDMGEARKLTARIEVALGRSVPLAAVLV